MVWGSVPLCIIGEYGETENGMGVLYVRVSSEAWAQDVALRQFGVPAIRMAVVGVLLSRGSGRPAGKFVRGPGDNCV